MKKWLRTEWEKLAPMTWKQRWEYIWDYYKLALIAAAVPPHRRAAAAASAVAIDHVYCSYLHYSNLPQPKVSGKHPIYP